MCKKACIIACDHGLGHIRRSLILAKEWEAKDYKVTVIASERSIKRIVEKSPLLKGVDSIDFNTSTTYELYKSSHEEIISWLKRLPDLRKYNKVISDNMPEILSVREDAIISSQFFWHKIVKGVNNDYQEYCERLLDKHEPIIIGCKIFAMEYIKRRRNYTAHALYKTPDLVRAMKSHDRCKQNDLLITGGSTPILNERLKRIVGELIDKGPGEYQNVHVDPQIMPNNPPHWINKATFTVDMYSRIKKAYCRPGLGVVTDLLTVDAEIIPIYESNNEEMVFNAKIIRAINKEKAKGI